MVRNWTKSASEWVHKSLFKGAYVDFVAAGVITAAILQFVGTGGSAMSAWARALNGIGDGPDNILASATLLNIAIILLGWRRYNDLRKEILEHRKAEAEAKALAITDPLTNCLNRRSINERTADLIAEADKRDMAVAFLMLDLDHFKTINDIHGHQAGDLVLQTVANRLGAVIPPRALLSRLGGDEFAIAFIFDGKNRSAVERVAEDVIEEVAKPIDGPAGELAISTSIGISAANHYEETAESLMRRADMAMYHSKKQGRNQFAWFESSMQTEIQTQNMIEKGLRTGIPAGEFIPYYEQQIDLESGKLVGFEVLARWNSSALGLVSPDIFIPIAEECGLISDLSESIMRRALTDALDWDSELILSVNISPIQLRDPWLSQKILKLLTETGYPAERLELEITESALFENIALAQSIIGSLKNQGVKIALDDFGTGYSSLSHLRALPFDRIKIDRSFVTTMDENSESAAIVEAIAQLGQNLRLPITAEGAESVEVVNRLRALGCGKVQGYHYGQPLSVEQTRWMLARANLLPNEKGALNSGSASDSAEQQPAAESASR
ncbi:putative bifunctional diguanylate cyclase/phosphodiesterase [Alterisphingorhabdus coralli]|uniref:EAL domain-containing protein n=1 Tax=Alterisphingorhabdus coralli TaxID=3071408 RepID=A0AA97FCI4_9SPHN|nr:EAL domain-containing protein [Parasphingorhabdus sp. SCSIO 66989]WOE76540.1 EAL domain-containing protein [Parasphingorhabdus sp. SCSIO 66989]